MRWLGGVLAGALVLVGGNPAAYADENDAAPAQAPPIAAAPAPAPAITPAPAPALAPAFTPVPVRVQLTTNRPLTTFHVRTAPATRTTAATHAPLCEAPCEVVVPAGSHWFALALARSWPVDGVEPVRIDGPSVVSGRYAAYSGLRKGGFVLLIGGVMIGTMIALSPFLLDDTGEPPDFTPITYLGAGLVAVSALLGTLMMAQGDVVTFRVTPMPAVRADRGPWRNEGGAGRTPALTAGLGLNVAF
jgi:hypothetical protein